MKKLSIVITCTLLFTLMADSSFAQSYCQDVLETGNPGGRTTGLKTCDLVNPEILNPGDMFAIDIWASDLPEPILSGGFLIEYNPSQMNIIGIQAYDGVDIAGPWDGLATYKQPNASGPGSYFLALLQLSCAVPDEDGDIILAKVTFQRLSDDNATINTLSSIPNYDTTVGCVSGFVYDLQIGTSVLNITQGYDSDKDGIQDTEDNCPAIANPDQADMDNDGIGNVCDDDADGDTYAIPADCNDNDPAINPGAAEQCSDGKDNNCDSNIDCKDASCVSYPACSTVEICNDGIDNDRDRKVDCKDPDCRNNPACKGCVVSESPETTCNDGRDNDCDGYTDCKDADCSGNSACQCILKGGACSVNGDCCSNRCQRNICR